MEAERTRVELLVLLGLAPGARDALDEVAAAVEEADGDHRHAELGGGLQVVAGEDAQPARVDREPGLEAELHAEVRDEDVAVVGMRLLPPGGGLVHRLRHRPGGS